MENISNHEQLPTTGVEIVLAKRRVFGNSAIPEGSVIKGRLINDIRLGLPILFETGNTSTLKSVEKDSTGRVHLDTNTSRYELIDNSFKGLDLDNQLGSVHLPPDAQPAKLNNEVVTYSFMTPTGKEEVYINKSELKPILLETNGAEIFRCVNGRFMVLARAGNIHIPFYISSQGTSGKNEGEWYPFFGYTGDWVIKGHDINENGEMPYHPEITKTREILNSNLRLPQRYFFESGQIGTGNPSSSKPDFVQFDLNQHLTFKDAGPQAQNGPEAAKFVAKMTGYNPRNVTSSYSTAIPWINSIVSQIK